MFSVRFPHPRVVRNSGCYSVVIQTFPHIKIATWRKACLENWRGEGQLRVTIQ